MPKVLDRDMLERSHIIEVLSPILLAFRKAFPDVKYIWVEKNVRSIKEVNIMLTKLQKKHPAGDVKKLLIMAIYSLCRLLADKRKYLAVELASCIIPFVFDAITCYMKIFNFFAVIRNEFVEQEKLQRKIRSFIPVNNCSEN
ncbi:7432_t:CDS:2 [Funneliformis mosseae]|uniref:7432_t:CDS:1 n=1 Tax=Funneliformis mosseae TaxID=27381 RepID=A0A9N8VT29_FUNMO|nr:7432_t:CDS:2 [Funneliformis mosseae]